MAITATDLAEIIGSATAMYLLFGLPLWIGVLITAADVLFILFFGTHNFRMLEVGAPVPDCGGAQQCAPVLSRPALAQVQ